MLTETAFADPGVAELVESLGLPVETAHTALRGVRDRINLVRIPYPATISGPDIRAGSSA
jgi:hypothetical protein